MAQVTELELPELDFFDVGLKGERFHRTMDELSSAGWLASSPIGYFVLDREAGGVLPAHQERPPSPGMKIAEMFEVPEGPLLEEMRRNILHINGDDHRRLRNLVNPAFTPRAADRWRPGDARVPRAALGAARRARIAASSSSAFAKPYPSLTIATVMGAPLEDAPKLHEWSNLIQRQFDGPSLLHERESIERACAEFYEWAGALIERRKDDPSDDLISTLIAAEQEGDRLSDVECMNLVLNVLVGGRRHDPVAARARAARCSPRTPTSGSCWPSARSWRRRRSRRSCATSRSRRSPRACCTSRSSTAT